MKRVVKEPEIRRMEIISAAKKLFEIKGFANTSVEAIIKEAGIAKGTFYYYFKTKQDILIALVAFIITDIESYFITIVNREDLSALEKLELMLIGTEKKEKIQPVVMEIIHKPENRELQEQLNIKTIELIAPLMAKVLEQGNNEGIFQAAAPLETMQLLLAGSQFVLDSGLFDWPQEKRVKLLKTIQHLTEVAIGAERGTLSFMMEV